MNPTLAKYLKIFFAALAIYALASAGIAWISTSPYRPSAGSDNSRVGFATQDVTIRASDGTVLRGWYSEVSDSAPVVAFFHGHSCTRTDCIPAARLLMLSGYSVLLMDMRACGLSDGALQSMGSKESLDVIASVKFLQEQKQFGSKRIGIVGVGTGASATILACDTVRELGGVALFAPDMSIEDACDYRFRQLSGLGVKGPGFLYLEFLQMRIGANPAAVRPVDMIAKLAPCPVYIFGAANDLQAPPESIQTMYKRAVEPKELYIAPNATREFLVDVNNLDLRKKLVDFFDTYLH
jgi:dienelactone hydrolase